MLTFFTRFCTLYKPFYVRNITIKRRCKEIGVCFLLAVFWSTAPLFGWSNYTLEKNLTSCSVDWVERSWNVMSYNVSLFVLGFIFPMAVVIYCNTKIILMIKSMPVDNVIFEAKSRKRILYEREITINTMIYVGINIHHKLFPFVVSQLTNVNDD